MSSSRPITRPSTPAAAPPAVRAGHWPSRCARRRAPIAAAATRAASTCAQLEAGPADERAREPGQEGRLALPFVGLLRAAAARARPARRRRRRTGAGRRNSSQTASRAVLRPPGGNSTLLNTAVAAVAVRARRRPKREGPRRSRRQVRRGQGRRSSLRGSCAAWRPGPSTSDTASARRARARRRHPRPCGCGEPPRGGRPVHPARATAKGIAQAYRAGNPAETRLIVEANLPGVAARTGREARCMRRAAVLLTAALALSAGASSADAHGLRAAQSVESSINSMRAQHGCGPPQAAPGLPSRAAGRQGAPDCPPDGKLDHDAGSLMPQRPHRRGPIGIGCWARTSPGVPVARAPGFDRPVRAGCAARPPPDHAPRSFLEVTSASPGHFGDSTALTTVYAADFAS